MLKKIKLGFKIIKYSPQIKSSLAEIIIFFIAGLSMLNPFGTNNDILFNFLGGFYMLFPGLMLHQMVQLASVPSLVNVSPLKKELRTSIPSIFSFMGTTFGYILFIVIQLVKLNIHQYTFDSYAVIATSFLFVGILALIMQIFCVFVNKYCLHTVIIFAVLLCAIMSFGLSAPNNVYEYLTAHLSLPSCVIIGYVPVISGSVLCYVFSSVLYKKDFDNNALKLTISW